MAVVGQVHKVLVGQGSQQRLQHAQATDAAVKHPDGGTVGRGHHEA